MAEKRYYWIKLKDTFMTSDTVDFLMGQKNGANYVVLYQMLCLKTINTNGELARKIGEIIIPYDAEKIQRDCKYFDIDTIRVALEIYKQLGLIYKQEDSILKIANFENMVGSETAWAEKKRLYREKCNRKLESGQSTDNVLDNFRQEKEKEKEKDMYVKDINNKIDITHAREQIVKTLKLSENGAFYETYFNGKDGGLYNDIVDSLAEISLCDKFPITLTGKKITKSEFTELLKNVTLSDLVCIANRFLCSDNIKNKKMYFAGVLVGQKR